MINVYLDIETIPNQSPAYRAKVREGIKPPASYKKQDSIDAWLAENADAATDEAIAKTSFDPAHGHICCIGWAIGSEEPQSVSMTHIDEEKATLQAFFDAISPQIGMACFIGHNVSGFDLRFLLCRSIVLGVQIPKIIPRDIKPWSQDIFDTMTAWAGARGTIGQARLAEALGLDGGKDDFDGSKVAGAWARGEHERIASYCRSDVGVVRQIYRKFEAVGF